ncbi:tip elongation aberrant protein 1-like [Solanum verrucosum]|uniref:tip elongation aberrant protein 1-like n=1 Tax=Solanum verrucosum TaxID=315347 RepID=UPI0020D0F051|nr:tip elongation aberrant protein 1-like [Solanum verrucosum]
MGSLGGEVSVSVSLQMKKPMWLYPKVMGVHPSERWGHSSCNSNGFVYVFGGCRGGLHFSDVLVLNLEAMAWSILVTTGQGPGPRDSHSAVLVGHRMVVFGGTNGSRKVNDIHVLDVRSQEWTQLECQGNPPSPRESHTATLVGGDKLVIFGGSGEGEANYLNDLHVLDLKTMRWSSPEVRGEMPVPRDSHSAVAIGNRLFIYGGDCGDRYQGDVDVLDMDTLMWSKLDVLGPSPGARAGHASVYFGSKVYVIGGVGDKKYYNDVWVLDVINSSWTQLDVMGQKTQGRFSHTAASRNTDIVIYGGCGEDERPLNELLILQFGVEYPNGTSSLSGGRVSGNTSHYDKKRFLRERDNSSEAICRGKKEDIQMTGSQEHEFVSKAAFRFSSDTLHPKRRRMSHNSHIFNLESDQEEDQSPSLSQRCSPQSQSDVEMSTIKPVSGSGTASDRFPFARQQHLIPNNCQPNPRNVIARNPHDLQLFREQPNPSNSSGHVPAVLMDKQEVQCQSLEPGRFHNLIGAEIRGKVDGAFDSGYLMTAIVNGKIFRGVLFAPAPDLVPRGPVLGQNPSPSPGHIGVNYANIHTNHINLGCRRQPQQLVQMQTPELGRQSIGKVPIRRSTSSVMRSSHQLEKDTQKRSELEGVVLTLGGPGCGNAKT